MKSLKRLQIDPLAVYGTLCVKCPLSDVSLADFACVSRVVTEIAIVQPKIVVVMGPDALVTLTFGKPSGSFPLGGDFLGRDVLSRVLAGGWLLLLMAVIATAIGIAAGAAAGVSAAYLRGRTDGLDADHLYMVGDRAQNVTHAAGHRSATESDEYDLEIPIVSDEFEADRGSDYGSGEHRDRDRAPVHSSEIVPDQLAQRFTPSLGTSQRATRASSATSAPRSLAAGTSRRPRNISAAT